jgi:Na+/melibiose symporter-like transporter
MSDFIVNNIALIIIAWFAFAILSGFVGKLKNRNPLSWALMGMFLGIFGVILALMISKKEQVKDSEEPSHTIDSELKYQQMKKDYLESKEKEQRSQE